MQDLGKSFKSFHTGMRNNFDEHRILTTEFLEYFLTMGDFLTLSRALTYVGHSLFNLFSRHFFQDMLLFDITA